MWKTNDHQRVYMKELRGKEKADTLAESQRRAKGAKE